jgi:hypothetical protein
MRSLFYFGEQVENYPVRVLNEREVRAGAGILFFFAMISFLNAFLVSNYLLTKIFVVVFFIDFFIRVLINPKFAPSLILDWTTKKKAILCLGDVCQIKKTI